MRTRQAQASDAALLTPLFHEMYRFYFTDVPTPDEVQHYLQTCLFGSLSGVQTFLIEDEQQVLGFATVSLLYPAPRLGTQAYMKELFIREAARGRRAGRQLMQHIARFALEHGCVRLDWTAEHSNPPAVAFYRHIGAEAIADKIYFRLSGDALDAFAHPASATPERE